MKREDGKDNVRRHPIRLLYIPTEDAMLRFTSLLIAGTILTAAQPASAITTPTFATSFVQAAAPHGAVGRDAGVDVSRGNYVRLSASGAFVSHSLGCGRSVGPAGCGGSTAPGAAGTLVAAFADSFGRVQTNWMPVGQYANLPVPLGAKRLVLRVTGMNGREYGAYRVFADVVPTIALAQLGSGSTGNGTAIHIGANGAAPSALRIGAPGGLAAGRTIAGRGPLATVGHGGSTGVIPSGTAVSRSDVHYALRRLGFSDTPSAITNVMNTGVSAWITAQLAAPAPANDASITNANVEALPVLTGNRVVDGNYSANIEDRLMQWQVNTQWQLREKMTLHWLEHFAVSNTGVNQAADMNHYIETVRADALGNYAKLLADVSKEPAMMIWLDNANNAYSPNNLPNENFGREVMQLYSLGVNTLNSDGSIVTDPNNAGQPLATYTEQDVKNMALALTGFQLQQQQQIGTYPAYVDKIAFNSAAHAPPTGNGGFQVMGQTIADGKNCPWTYTMYQQSGLNNTCVIDNAAAALANNPTTWAYESKELLQRLVTETPSAAMVQRISTVWGKTVNDQNQMAKVVAAIGADPEFYNGKYMMVKEPIEFEVGAIRALGGATSNPVTSSETRPLSSAISDTARMAQELWYPPSVFSFYYPGDKESMINNAQLLAVWSSATNLANGARTTACTNCAVFLDFSSFATAKQTNDLAGYLLDALVDGGTPQLNALVRNFLNNNPSNVQGALWIILSSPEYGVN